MFICNLCTAQLWTMTRAESNVSRWGRGHRVSGNHCFSSFGCPVTGRHKDRTIDWKHTASVIKSHCPWEQDRNVQSSLSFVSRCCISHTHYWFVRQTFAMKTKLHFSLLDILLKCIIYRSVLTFMLFNAPLKCLLWPFTSLLFGVLSFLITFLRLLLRTLRLLYGRQENRNSISRKQLKINYACMRNESAVGNFYLGSGFLIRLVTC